MKKKANEWDGLKEGNGKEVKIQFHLNPSKSVFFNSFLWMNTTSPPAVVWKY
jgi:hypothetical protein